MYSYLHSLPIHHIIRFVYIGELSHLSCVDYVLQDPRLSGCTREEVLSVLATVGMY